MSASSAPALIQMWAQAGILGQAKKRLSRPLGSARIDRADDHPCAMRVKQLPVMGEAGQPGYPRCLTGTAGGHRADFQTLLPASASPLGTRGLGSRRPRKALREHQKFLREESRSLRRKTIVSQLIRAARAFSRENLPAG